MELLLSAHICVSAGGGRGSLAGRKLTSALDGCVCWWFREIDQQIS